MTTLHSPEVLTLIDRLRAACAAAAAHFRHAELSAPPEDREAAGARYKRRLDAALRLPPLPCGHRDPLDCEQP